MTRPRTIGILSVRPFPAVTSRTITQAAVVSHSSILCNFALMEHPFVAVFRDLSDRFAEELPPCCIRRSRSTTTPFSVPNCWSGCWARA